MMSSKACALRVSSTISVAVLWAFSTNSSSSHERMINSKMSNFSSGGSSSLSTRGFSSSRASFLIASSSSWPAGGVEGGVSSSGGISGVVSAGASVVVGSGAGASPSAPDSTFARSLSSLTGWLLTGCMFTGPTPIFINCLCFVTSILYYCL